jgi:hypothetical protein
MREKEMGLKVDGERKVELLFNFGKIFLQHKLHDR